MGIVRCLGRLSEHGAPLRPQMSWDRQRWKSEMMGVARTADWRNITEVSRSQTGIGVLYIRCEPSVARSVNGNGTQPAWRATGCRRQYSVRGTMGKDASDAMF